MSMIATHISGQHFSSSATSVSQSQGNTLQKKNFYMTSEAMQLRKMKRELWCNSRCKNRLRGLTRTLCKESVRDIVGKIKQDPKQFWKYPNSRSRTKPRINDLRDKSGRMVSEDKDKAEIINRTLQQCLHKRKPGFNSIARRQHSLMCLNLVASLFLK